MSEITKPTLECLNTEDGDPWGVYAYGHVDPASITLEAVNAALDWAGHEPIDAADVEHLWMQCDADDGSVDYPWHWCAADVTGAIAVTGVKFS